MKNRLTLFLCLIFSTAWAFAQKGSLIAVPGGGLAIPVPNLRLDGSKGTPGFAGEFRYQYRFRKSHLAATIEVRGRQNPMVPLYKPSKPHYNSNGYVKTAAVLLGVAYIRDIDKRWSVQARLAFGGAKLNLDSVKQQENGPGASTGPEGAYGFKTGKASGQGLTSVFAIGPSYRLTRHLRVFLQAEYWYTHPQTLQTDILSIGYISRQDPAYLSKDPSTVDILAGIGVYF